MGTFPESLTPAGHVAPVPRRIRGYLGAECVLDTQRARYVWEWPPYPQYYVPLDDVAPGLLADEGVEEDRVPGTAHRHRVGGRGGTAWVHRDGDLAGHVRFEWSALDAWFEEDERVFVHPRSPYARVDALRSGRTVRVELGGSVLAESSSPVRLAWTYDFPTRQLLPIAGLVAFYDEKVDTFRDGVPVDRPATHFS